MLSVHPLIGVPALLLSAGPAHGQPAAAAQVAQRGGGRPRQRAPLVVPAQLELRQAAPQVGVGVAGDHALASFDDRLEPVAHAQVVLHEAAEHAIAGHLAHCQHAAVHPQKHDRVPDGAAADLPPAPVRQPRQQPRAKAARAVAGTGVAEPPPRLRQRLQQVALLVRIPDAMGAMLLGKDPEIPGVVLRREKAGGHPLPQLRRRAAVEPCHAVQGGQRLAHADVAARLAALPERSQEVPLPVQPAEIALPEGAHALAHRPVHGQDVDAAIASMCRIAGSPIGRIPSHLANQTASS